MKSKKLLVTLSILLGLAGSAYANPIEEGKTIFLSRCAACHNVNKVLTGPALAGVEQRRSLEWITRFIHSSQTLIKSGDKDAVAIYEKFNKIPMPDHPDLSETHIKSIVEYIKSEAKPAEESTAPFAKPSRKETIYRPLSLQKDYGFFLGYLAIVVVLIAVLLLAVRVTALKNKIRGGSI